MKRFMRDRAGSIMVATGLLLPMIVAAGAVALDYSNAVRIEARAQAAADAAAIAAATRSKEVGEKIFRDRMAQLSTDWGDLTTLDVGSAGGLGTVDAQIKMRNMFSRLGLGDQILDVSAAAQAGSQTPIDVVMALDYSGSMGVANRYVKMGNAAKSFVDTFIDTGSVRLGLVPFAKHTLLTIDGRYLFDSYNGGSLLGSNYLACVNNRGYPNAVQIDTPTESDESSLWPAVDYAPIGLGSGDGDWASANPYGNPPPWLYDAGPNVVAFDAGYYVQYFNDGLLYSGFVTDLAQISGDDIAIASTDLAARKTLSDGSTAWVWGSSMCNFETAWRAGQCGDPPSAPSYAGTSGTSDPGSESNAPATLLAVHVAAEQLADASCKSMYDRNLLTRALSADLAKMRTEIDTMSPGGLTNIALAFDIAWHVVSDNAPWTESGDGTSAQKVVILLTDGVQTMKAPGPDNEYSVSAANKNTAEICSAMKEAGVTVYTVAYGINDSFTNTLLGDCATSLAHFFQPNGEDNLSDTFDEIAKSLKTPARIVH